MQVRSLALYPETQPRRLAAQVPPPRRHMVKYHGVLAPAAGYRDQVVPEDRPYRDAVHPHRRKPPASAAGADPDPPAKLPAEPPALAPARPPPQPLLPFVG